MTMPMDAPQRHTAVARAAAAAALAALAALALSGCSPKTPAAGETPATTQAPAVQAGSDEVAEPGPSQLSGTQAASVEPNATPASPEAAKRPPTAPPIPPWTGAVPGLPPEASKLRPDTAIYLGRFKDSPAQTHALVLTALAMERITSIDATRAEEVEAAWRQLAQAAQCMMRHYNQTQATARLESMRDAATDTPQRRAAFAAYVNARANMQLPIPGPAASCKPLEKAAPGEAK